jgi:hypothetical protein
MALMPVHSYSGCWHTEGLQSEGSYEFKQNVSQQYAFHLAFENLPLDDYVTEKFFQPFKYGEHCRVSLGIATHFSCLRCDTGTLPIYWGAPNIADFAPGPNSFINAMDFAGPDELVAHVKKVHSDRALYESYFEWRKQGLSRRFYKMAEFNFGTKNHRPANWRCRLCEAFAQRYCL